jgi:hypothetical protein
MNLHHAISRHLTIAILGLLFGIGPGHALQNGTAPTRPEARAVVHLAIERAGAHRACTGVLIAPTLVLTAGHCVFGAAAISAQAISGKSWGASVEAQLWTAHPLWAGPKIRDGWDRAITARTSAHYVDLGLVALSAPIAGTEPLSLASAQPETGARVRAVGLHRTRLLERPIGLSAGAAIMVGRFGAPAVFRVAGEQGVAWCPGDSGSPILGGPVDRPTVVGIVGLGLALPVSPKIGSGRTEPCGTIATVIDPALHRSWIEATSALLSAPALGLSADNMPAATGAIMRR